MADNKIFENENEKLILDVPKEQRHLNTVSYDYSVEFLVSQMKGEQPKIILEVPFQRQFVWNLDKSSRLIESIIMNVPIPPVYFAEEEDGRWLVIDGLQRLNSLLQFYQNEFKLKKLDIISELDKHKYKDLPPKSKALLNNGLIRVNVIKRDSHPDIKYDIFMRLNKGAVTLNYQELRNCLYRGNLNSAAKELVEENSDFLEMINLKKPHKRFLDVEMIIRHLALKKGLTKNENEEYFIENYNGRMVTFLNHFMDENKNISLEEKEKIKESFNLTILKLKTVFGVQEALKDPTTEKSKANRALTDCMLLSFDAFGLDFLTLNKEKIKKELFNLLTKDEKFKDSITFRTSDKGILNYRVNIWFKKIESFQNV